MEENIIFCLSIFTVVLMVIKSNLFAQTDKHNKADIEFDKRNYKKAIKLYNDSLKDEIDSNEINSIKYKIALCYFYLDDDKNLDTLIADIREHNKDNVWEAKSFYLEGISYVEGYYSPEAIQLLEKARALYPKYVDSSEITEEDIIELDMALIRCFDEGYGVGEGYIDNEEKKRREEESLLEETNPFSSDWKIEKKIVYLFRRLLSYQKNNTDNYYKFVYDYANFFRRNGETEIYKNEYKRHFDDIINNSNDNDLIASSYYLLGVNCKDNSEFVEAVDYFNILIERYPESKWVDEAKGYIQMIKEPKLDVKMKTQFYLNENITANIISKNIKSVNYKVYEIDLISFHKDNISNIKDINKYIIKEHLNCDINTSIKGDYKECTDTVEIVDKNIFNKIGQYLFVASSEGMTVTFIFFVTDLILINRTENNKIHSWVVDSENGKPIGDVSVLALLYSSKDDILITGKTNNKGLCSIDIDRCPHEVKSIVYKGKSFASTEYYWYSRTRDIYKNSLLKYYCITDRPIYRPGQKVYFKCIFKNQNYGELEPLKKCNVVLNITNSRSQKIYKKNLITNEYGSVWDEILLDEEASLGTYWVSASVKGFDGSSLQDLEAFVVEEYKRPEYEVNIESSSKNLKLGQKIEFKISAKYYYGEPVHNAEITYKVLRSRYQYIDYSTHFNREREDDRWYYNKKEELIESKTLPLNTDGTLTLNYETESLLNNNDWEYDYKYTIKAEVSDKSRRTVKLNKSFIVSRKEFNIFISNEIGFISPNENTKFEIIARTNNNELKIADGIIQIFKINPKDKKDDYDSVLIKSTEFKTSKKNSYFTYKFSESGKYKIEFETKDTYGEAVSSHICFYVVDSKFFSESYYFNKLEMIPEKKTYSEGEYLRILINSDVLSANLLISVQAENEILKQEVIKVEGKSFIYNYKISERDVPNIFVKVYSIHDNKIFIEECEIFVPSVKQFVNMSLTANKEKYEPNEKVNLKIKTVDYKNDPIKSEISLSVFDASLRGLQDFCSLNVKKYFYGYLRKNDIKANISSNYSSYSNLVSTRASIRYPEEPDGYKTFSSFFYNCSLTLEKFYSYEGIMYDLAPYSDDTEEPDFAFEENILKNVIREDFRELLYWNPTLLTNENGLAEVSFNMNDALTEWDVVAKGITKKSEVGESETSFVSKKDFILRAQTPRFLQERDEVTISANIHNYTLKDFNVDSLIEYDKQYLQLLTDEQITKMINKEGELRVDWVFKVIKKGSTEITIIAKGDNNFDAVKIKLPILEYGIEKTIVYNGSCSNEDVAVIEIDIPDEIRERSANITINLLPTSATVVLSALPYLLRYPYGCFEQTLNRFIPITIVSEVMKGLNIDLYNLHEISKKTGRKYEKGLTEVFLKKEVEKIKQEGLKRVYDFQNPDGSFSWWQSESRNLYMTALGITSLTTALRMGMDVDHKVINKALNSLDDQINSEEKEEKVDNNLMVFVQYAISEWEPKLISNEKLDALFALRDELSYYSIALLGLTYRNLFRYENGTFDKHVPVVIDEDISIIDSSSDSDYLSKLKIIYSDLIDEIEIDDSNDTAFWNSKSPHYWRWYNGNIETSATILKFINSVNPKNENLVKVVNWLINHRRGIAWDSTKDTALLLEVLMEYIKTHRELDVDYMVTVSFDEKPIDKVKIDRNNILTCDNIFKINEVPLGKHKIKIEKNGVGNLKYQMLLNYFPVEDSIFSVGNDIFIKREYYRLIKESIKNDEGVESILYKEVPLLNDETLTVGDEIRVKLKIVSKNDYEYLAFEDRKPSGAEYKLLKSWGGYMELRDEKVLFFKTYLRQGMTEIQYDLRAEIPGKFNVMPAIGYAMYAPDISANSESIKINIVDKVYKEDNTQKSDKQKQVNRELKL